MSSTVIQDWSPYNESVIWEIANHYYQNKGIQAFSNASGNAVPHNVNTNYQNALALAKLVKTVVEQNPRQERHEVLECGAGSGLFSMHFLYALKELGIDNQVKLLITDYSDVGLKEIKKLNMLFDFTEGENYELLVLDVLDPSKSHDLDGKARKIKDASSIIHNYVLDALNTTVLKRNGSNFEELYLKIDKHPQENYDILANTTLLANLVKTPKWVSYDIQAQSELEQKYYDFFSKYYAGAAPTRLIPYPYVALEACQNLLDLLSPDGFMFSGDIPAQATEFCQVVGNALAHEIDCSLICNYFHQANYAAKFQVDHTLARMLICHNKETLDLIDPVFEDVYVKNNLVNRYLDLREVLINFKHKESMDMMKVVLEEFEKIAGNSLYKGVFWGNYYANLNDREQAAKAYEEALSWDFLNNYNIDMLIKKIKGE